MEKIKVKTKKLYTQETYDNVIRTRIINKDWTEFDKWMNKLIKENGTTNYQFYKLNTTKVG